MDSKKSKNYFHLAGIIPVAGQKLDFNLPWHDCCMPISANYLAIERAVVECAYAGCETIWVVCHDDMQPLIRHRLGDYINDPVWVSRIKDTRPSESKKQIPIFYVPVHPKDRDRRDCLSWSILYGAQSSYSVGLQISKWITPDRYYVAFPYGVYPVELLREHRDTISSKKGFYLSHDNKTVKDGEYLGFTFNSEEFLKLRKKLRDKATGLYTSEINEDGMPSKKYPTEQRYSARFFTLDEVFESLVLENKHSVEIPWYYNISSWDGYCQFLASKDKDEIRRPSKGILSYHEFNKIGQEE
tara:strand:+ start:386 stop:1282 length:897 start_codon:yes stop_codon:yes gene_type:complete